MSRHGSTCCARCSENAGFDAKLAFENLARKQAQLADLVARYMSEAGLERSVRNSNALEISAQLERIVGGRPVPRGGFPECCLVGHEFTNGSVEWFCTGVLVHPRVVLTAAHCHNPSGLLANIVALDAEDKDRLGEADIVRAHRAVSHPAYRPDTKINDIEVVILMRDSRVSPVAIASSSEVHASSRTALVGFGNDNLQASRGFGIKREVEVPITALRRQASDNLDEAERRFRFESDLEFVAGGEGFDSCTGDSGGPAYVIVNGSRKVAGLTSRGFDSSPNPCGDGGVYTRVDKHPDFIRDVMSRNGLSLGRSTSAGKHAPRKKAKR